MAIDYGGRKSKDEPPDLEELIEYLEGRVDRLKVLYEQFFMGIEKVEPQTARKEVERKIIELTQLNMRNTALRYRFNALNQKWGVYRTYWNRTLREIEKGTYIRNISKVGREALRKGQDIPEEVLRSMPEKMRERIIKERALVAERVVKSAARRGTPLTEPAPPGAEPAHSRAETVRDATPVPARPEDPREDEETDIDALFDRIRQPTAKPRPIPPEVSAPRPPAPPPPPPAPAPAPARATPAPARATPPPAHATPPPAHATPPPRPAAKLPPGMDDAKVQELYKRYVQAKRLVGEDVSKVKVENLVATISSQAPRIMTQYGAKAVEFSVVVKDNRVILKATPKK